MNILITGAAGFIGSHTSEKLLSRGHTVTGIDNFDPFYPKLFKLRNLEEIMRREGFQFKEGNILDLPFLDKLFSDQQFDVVIHLAAKAGIRPSIDRIVDYYETNVNGTVNLLESMKTNGVKNMLFASSSSIYGNNIKTPFSENDPVDYPISPYASTKKSGELLCHVYCHLYQFNITCLRFFTVFGPRQRPDLAIHKFTHLIDAGLSVPFFGDGSTARDYTYIEDITDGIDCALGNLAGFRLFNLGESRVVTLKKLIQVIEQRLKKSAILDMKPMQPGDVQITFADITKAQKEIGYKPNTGLEEGIDQFVNWYIENKKILYP